MNTSVKKMCHCLSRKQRESSQNYVACKTMEERIFYMNLCIKERLSKRELERQIDSGYYERYMLSQKPLTSAIEESRRASPYITIEEILN